MWSVMGGVLYQGGDGRSERSRRRRRRERREAGGTTIQGRENRAILIWRNWVALCTLLMSSNVPSWGHRRAGARNAVPSWLRVSEATLAEHPQGSCAFQVLRWARSWVVAAGGAALVAARRARRSRPRSLLRPSGPRAGCW